MYIIVYIRYIIMYSYYLHILHIARHGLKENTCAISCHQSPMFGQCFYAPAKKGHADAQRLLPQRRFFGSLLERTCHDNADDTGTPVLGK